jgi:HAD superfamily hydrolase (TIGR01509 family)
MSAEGLNVPGQHGMSAEGSNVAGQEVAGFVGVRGAIFDFNGTITDDEGLLYEIYAELFDEWFGLTLDRDIYFTELAGLSEPGIVARIAPRYGLELSPERRAELLAERVRRYAERVAGAPPVRPGAAALVRELAARIPLALGTGAFRSEVESVLKATELYDCFTTIVTIEDVQRGKPDPQTFELALAGLGLPADAVIVFEDSSFGVSAARAAGLRCVVVPVSDDFALAAGGGTEVVVPTLHPGLVTTPP